MQPYWLALYICKLLWSDLEASIICKDVQHAYLICSHIL